MKTKLFLFSMFFISFTSFSYSQDNKVVLGAGGGIALTNMKFNDSLDLYNPSIRPHFGVFIDFKLSRRIYLGSGLNIRSKGFRSDEITFTDVNGNTIRDGKMSYSFNYLTIPLIANYYFGEKVKFRIGVGGYYGILLKATIDLPIEVEGQENPFDITDQYSSSDFGIVARAGFMMPITERLYFNFDIVDEFGLSSVDKKAANYGIYTSGFKAESLSAAAGLAFSF